MINHYSKLFISQDEYLKRKWLAEVNQSSFHNMPRSDVYTLACNRSLSFHFGLKVADQKISLDEKNRDQTICWAINSELQPTVASNLSPLVPPEIKRESSHWKLKKTTAGKFFGRLGSLNFNTALEIKFSLTCGSFRVVNLREKSIVCSSLVLIKDWGFPTFSD